VVEAPPVEAPSKEEEKVEVEVKQSKRKPKAPPVKREAKAGLPAIKVPDPSPERIDTRASPEKKTKVIAKEEKFDPERWKRFQAYHSISVR
jgi:hypothetical protein